jgi:hypothetical protein
MSLSCSLRSLLARRQAGHLFEAGKAGTAMIPRFVKRAMARGLSKTEQEEKGWARHRQRC